MKKCVLPIKRYSISNTNKISKKTRFRPSILKISKPVHIHLQKNALILELEKQFPNCRIIHRKNLILPFVIKPEFCINF